LGRSRVMGRNLRVKLSARRMAWRLERGRAREVLGVIAAKLAVRHGCGGGEVLASEAQVSSERAVEHAVVVPAGSASVGCCDLLGFLTDFPRVTPTMQYILER
jgi:hypothetical protein